MSEPITDSEWHKFVDVKLRRGRSVLPLDETKIAQVVEEYLRDVGALVSDPVPADPVEILLEVIQRFGCLNDDTTNLYFQGQSLADLKDAVEAVVESRKATP